MKKVTQYILMYRFSNNPEVMQYIGDDRLAAPFFPTQTVVTVPDSEANCGAQSIYLTTLMPKNVPTGTVLVGPAIGERQTRDFQQWRLAIIAELLGMRAIGYDFPVMGGETKDERNRLTPRQLEEARNLGSFSLLGANIWRAIELLDGDNDSGMMTNTVLWGDSMGAFLSGGLINSVPDHVNIKDLVLIEPAGLGPLSERHRKQTLVTAFAMSSNLKYYLGMNPQHPQVGVTPMTITARRIARHPNAAFVTPVDAMARGGLAGQLILGLSKLASAPNAHIFHAENDRVSPYSLNVKLAEQLRAIGVTVNRTFMNGEYHGMTDSMPIIAEIIRRVVYADLATGPVE